MLQSNIFYNFWNKIAFAMKKPICMLMRRTDLSHAQAIIARQESRTDAPEEV